MKTFLVRPVYGTYGHIVGYVARQLDESGFYTGESRETFPTSREAVLDAEAAGWVYDDDGTVISILSDSGDGGCFTMRDLAMRE